MAYALPPLVDLFEGCTVAEVTLETCERYTEQRCRSGAICRSEQQPLATTY